MTRISVILLVDPQGRVLLQERDEHAPLSPEKWGMVGGHGEDGEDPEVAAYRELEEETGLRLDGGLRLWWSGEFCYSELDEAYDYRVWVAPTTVTDADVVVGEGRQIVFVDPAEVPGLDLAESARHFVVPFLASPEYAGLVAEAAGQVRA